MLIIIKKSQKNEGVMNDRQEMINIIDVNLDDLSPVILKIMADFFAEKEIGALGNIIFEKDQIYGFDGDKKIKFNKQLIGYQKYNHENDKAEWIYSVRNDVTLGKGAVYRASGKLIHEMNGNMRYIAPENLKVIL